MATILEFRSDGEKVPLKLVRRKRRSAEIVIFPGVRYMHIPDEAEDLFAIATAPLKSPSKGKK